MRILLALLLTFAPLSPAFSASRVGTNVPGSASSAVNNKDFTPTGTWDFTGSTFILPAGTLGSAVSAPISGSGTTSSPISISDGAISSSKLDLDIASQAELDTHEGDANIHHTPTVDTFVTNKDSHDHLSGDGAQIQHTSLGTVGTSDHHVKTVDTNAQTQCNTGEVLDGDGGCQSISGFGHSDGTNCSVGEYAQGVDASGNAQGCTADADTIFTHPDPHRLANGNNGGPAYSFASNTATGMYYFSSFGGSLKFAKSATDMLILGSGGNVATFPSHMKLEVDGTLQYEHTSRADDTVLLGDSNGDATWGKVTTSKLATDSVTNAKILTDAVDARAINPTLDFGQSVAISLTEVGNQFSVSNTGVAGGISLDSTFGNLQLTATVNDVEISAGNEVSVQATTMDVSADILTVTGGIATSDKFYGDGSALTGIDAEPGDGTITTAKLATDSVTSAKILDGNVTPEKLSETYLTSELWSENGGDVYITGKQIGIGVADPDQELELNGDMKFTATGSRIYSVNTELVRLNPASIVFNEGSSDVDFRFESNTNNQLLYLDGGSSRIGIGLSTPLSNALTIAAGGIDIATNGNGIQTNTSDASDNEWTYLAGGGTDGNTRGGTISVHGNEETNTGQVIIEAGDVGGGDIILKVNGSTAMTIDQNTDGNVGIGVTNPSALLHVQGSVRIADGTQSSGYVMTSDADGDATWQPSAGGGETTWTKYTKTWDDFNDSGAGQDIKITLATLSAQTFIQAIVLKHSASFSGNDLTGYDISVWETVQGNLNNAHDVTGTPGNGDVDSGDWGIERDVYSNIYWTSTDLKLRCQSGGGVTSDCEDATAGSVDVWILTSTLP